MWRKFNLVFAGVWVVLLSILGLPRVVLGQESGLLCQARRILSTTPTGGVPQDLVVANQTVFVVDREIGLLSYNVSAADSPQLLSTLPTDGAPAALDLMGAHAFVAGELGVQIIGVDDPSAPVVVGSIALFSEAEDIEIAPGVAYVALSTPESGLAIVDIHDPTAPTLLAYYATDHTVRSVTVTDGTAFLGLGSAGMVVLDVSDPSTPVEIALYDTTRVYELIVDNQIGYTATWYGMATIDLADPSQPQLLWESNAIRGRTDMTVADGFAYMDGASAVYDITDPSAPVPIVEFPNTGRQSVIQDGLAYVITNDSLVVFDVSDPPPNGVTGLVEVRDSEGLAIKGNHAFLSAWTEGLVVLDVSDPHNPFQIASLDLPNIAHHLDIEGDYVYVSTSAGLAIVDVSNPAAPELVVPPTNYRGSRVAVGDGVVAVQGTRLYFVDVSDPLNPIHLATQPFGASRDHGGVRVTNGHVFQAVGILRVFDLSDPQADPVATIEDWPGLNAVDVQGDLACVAGRYNLALLDVSDPADPQLLGHMDLPADTPQSVKLVGDLAFVGFSSRGLWVVDISDTSAPVLLASTDRWVDRYPIFDIEVRGQSAMMATGLAFRILDISDCPPCPADFNGDGVIDTRDFVAFLGAWASQRGEDCSGGDCTADLNGDGVVDTRDFVEFLGFWAGGC